MPYLRLLIVSVLLAIAAATATAVAATRMTAALAERQTWKVALRERSDADRWPDGARVTVRDCKAVTARRGRCFYDIDTYAADNTHKSCTRRVRVTIADGRVHAERISLGCQTS